MQEITAIGVAHPFGPAIEPISAPGGNWAVCSSVIVTIPTSNYAAQSGRPIGRTYGCMCCDENTLSVSQFSPFCIASALTWIKRCLAGMATRVAPPLGVAPTA